MNEQAAAGLKIRQNVRLSEYTTMRVGGNARYFAEVTRAEDVPELLLFAEKQNLPLLVLGNGSNTLVRDGGFEGLVLHFGDSFAQIKVEGTKIIAQAGAKLPAVAREAAEHSLTGFEFAGGIPGSVGGAVFMNAGAYGGEIAQVLESVTLLEDGQIRTLSVDEMELSYRHSRLNRTGGLVLEAVFRLKAGNPQEISQLMSDFTNRRREKQPLQYPSCGSFFKRPKGYFAGALIEQANLKGYRVGGAQVSEKHAGFIINTGSATARDVLELMKYVQKTVSDRFGVMLEPEVRIEGIPGDQEKDLT